MAIKIGIQNDLIFFNLAIQYELRTFFVIFLSFKGQL